MVHQFKKQLKAAKAVINAFEENAVRDEDFDFVSLSGNERIEDEQR